MALLQWRQAELELEDHGKVQDARMILSFTKHFTVDSE